LLCLSISLITGVATTVARGSWTAGAAAGATTARPYTSWRSSMYGRWFAVDQPVWCGCNRTRSAERRH